MQEISRPIEVITQEINFYKVQAGTSIIEIGRRLCEAKQCLPHGSWGKWLAEEVEFSERSAQNFMKIAREYGNPQVLADIGNSTTKALLLLSVPPEEREEFVAEAHEVEGEEKTVAEMTTGEMERLIKELEAERKEKDKLQAQLDLFGTQSDQKIKVLEAELKEAKDANETAGQLVWEKSQEVMDNLNREKEAAEKARQEAEDRIKGMEAEMDELRMQAKQTAIPDETELEKIRSEAETAAIKKAEMIVQKKLDKARQDAKKAKEKAEQAEKAIEVHEKARYAAEKEMEDVREEAEKRVRMAGASDVAVFKVHFESCQSEINKMLSCIEKAKEMNVTEGVRLENALKALCNNIIEIIEKKGD